MATIRAMTTREELPPGQQLAAAGKWPLVGERIPAADDGPWNVTIAGLVDAPRTWSLAELRSFGFVELVVDIHCVTRWSKFDMRFAGVMLADLLAAARPSREARFLSFVAHSPRAHSTSLPLADAIKLETMIALEANGEPIPREHGGPVRLVTPGRYFYKSLKWLRRIDVLAEDRLGYWEAEAGYHNNADPWREERFLAASLSRQEMREILSTRNFAGRDLRSLDAAGHSLEGLDARGALLRNADFSRAKLSGANFSGTNLSNAHFASADLRGALFHDADVEGADFAGADLRGADFRGGSLVGTTFMLRQNDDTMLAARMDSSTQFDAPRLEDLVPEQSAFVRTSVQ
jgi:DMSO/TMAO reductase YedYZ molybdopterin-dependent catalytic subunit